MPRLLFLSPTMPAISGHGGAMRAGAFIEALSRTYDISLVVINLWERQPFAGAALTRHCTSVQEFSLSDVDAWRGGVIPLALTHEGVERVHVFRLAMTRFVGVRPHGESVDRCQYTLDLDDFESKLARRTAALHSLRGDSRSAAAYGRRAEQLARREAETLPFFDDVYVCQRGDRDELRHAHPGGSFHVIPNCVRLPQVSRTECFNPFIILFVGTLDYFPNEDAVLWFHSCILPLIRAATAVPVHLWIAGSRPSEAVRNLAGAADVTVTADPVSLEGLYRRCAIAIAPVRIGGGTRIKILEAMSFAKPVVSTTVGAEGLDVHPNNTILLGNSASEFATHCLALMRDEALRTRISSSGLEFVRSQHSLEVVCASIEEVSRQLRERVSDDSRVSPEIPPLRLRRAAI